MSVTLDLSCGSRLVPAEKYLGDLCRAVDCVESESAVKPRHRAAHQAVNQRLRQLFPEREDDFGGDAAGLFADRLLKFIVTRSEPQDLCRARAVNFQESRAALRRQLT